LASGLATTLASRTKSFLVLFFKKELLVFTYFFIFWTDWELQKVAQKTFAPLRDCVTPACVTSINQSFFAAFLFKKSSISLLKTFKHNGVAVQMPMPDT
jgi:hypothetical protein